MKPNSSFTFGQTLWLVILRVMISWHFIYEGLAKILSPGWSVPTYLSNSNYLFTGFYQHLATNGTLLSTIEFINMIGLTLVGICLLLGLFSRFASIIGICFLAISHFFHPFFIESEYMIYVEESYLWIDRNIIEISALMVLIYFPTSHIIGADRFIYPLFIKKKVDNEQENESLKYYSLFSKNIK